MGIKNFLDKFSGKNKKIIEEKKGYNDSKQGVEQKAETEIYQTTIEQKETPKENPQLQGLLKAFHNIRFYNQHNRGSGFMGLVFSLPREQSLDEQMKDIEEKMNTLEKIRNHNITSLQTIGLGITEIMEKTNSIEEGEDSVPDEINITVEDVDKFIQFLKTLSREDVFKNGIGFFLENKHEEINKTIRDTIMNTQSLNEDYKTDTLIILHELIEEFTRLREREHIRRSKKYMICLQHDDPKQCLIDYEFAVKNGTLKNSRDFIDHNILRPHGTAEDFTHLLNKRYTNYYFKELSEVQTKLVFDECVQEIKKQLKEGREGYEKDGMIRKDYLKDNDIFNNFLKGNEIFQNNGRRNKHFDNFLETIKDLEKKLLEIEFTSDRE